MPLILTCQLIEQGVKELSSSGRHGFKFGEPFTLDPYTLAAQGNTVDILHYVCLF